SGFAPSQAGADRPRVLRALRTPDTSSGGRPVNAAPPVRACVRILLGRARQDRLPTLRPGPSASYARPVPARGPDMDQAVDRVASLVGGYAHQVLADLLRSGDVPHPQVSSCADKGWRVLVSMVSMNHPGTEPESRRPSECARGKRCFEEGEEASGEADS